MINEAKELQERVRKLEAEKNEHENTMEDAISKAADLEKEKEALSQDLEFVQLDLEELQAKYELATVDLELLKESEATMKEDIIDTLKGDEQELAIAIDARDRMEEALTTLKDAFATEVRKRDVRVAQLENKEKLVPELQEKNKDLHAELSKCKQTIVENKSDISELGSQIDMLQESADMVQSLIEKNIKLEQKVAELTDDNSVLQESLDLQEEFRSSK
eukprot:UN33767